MYREIGPQELRLTKDTGYLYFIDKNHPLKGGSSNRVYYHRHMASIKLGRWLASFEHVHHIDGDKQNNTPSNLEVLSNSAHAIKHSNNIIIKVCPSCGVEFLPKYNRIKYCSPSCVKEAATKLNSLTKSELEVLIWTTPYTKLAEQFKCSDNGIKKWAIRLGCLLPPPYFHSKMYNTSQRLDMYNAALAQLVECLASNQEANS